MTFYSVLPELIKSNCSIMQRLKKATAPQAKKIEAALHKSGSDFMTVELLCRL
jgi:hypothetical protein